MDSLWYYLSCCYGCGCFASTPSELKRYAQQKRTDELKNLKAIKPQSDNKDMVWKQTKDPMDIKTEEMSQTFDIPSDKYKNEREVLLSLGFKMNVEIGCGSFGIIYTAVHLQSKLTIAIKKIIIPEASDQKSREKRMDLLRDVKYELFALLRIRHPHVVKLVQHLIIRSKNLQSLYILMQLAENGNLENYCEVNGAVGEEKSKHWFSQMLSGLSFMHREGIAHRDLKVSNILLDTAFDVLIADFGLSRLVWRQSKDQLIMSQTFCGTPPYMAPEVLMVKENNFLDYNAFLADVWSLGVILFVMFCTSYPFAKKPKLALKRMAKREWKYPKESKPSVHLQSFFKTVFEPNPNVRPTMKALQKHVWIKDEFDKTEIRCLQKMRDNNTN